MLPKAVRHPVFARLWSLMSRHEPAEIRRHRDELLAGLSGRVIEVGAGPGSNFAHYPASVDEVVAVEPEPYLRERARALEELGRVLRPDGELRFYEHVLSPRPALASSQRAVDRVFWPHAFGGCHTARDTPAAIAAAGFEVEHQRHMWVNPVPIAFPVAPHVIGRARRRWRRPP
jgi:hypothetical protein